MLINSHDKENQNLSRNPPSALQKEQGLRDISIKPNRAERIKKWIYCHQTEAEDQDNKH